MSLPLQRFFLADPFTTPRGWSITVPGATAGATLYLHNQTDTSMDVYGDGNDSAYLGTIPAELGFFAIRPKRAYLSLEFRPGTVLNADSAPSAYVDGQYFAPNEPDPGYPMIGLSRLVNVGNAVIVGTSPILEGSGQVNGVTTRDIVGSPGGPGLIPATVENTLSGTSIALVALDGNGNPKISTMLAINATLAQFYGPLTVSGLLALAQNISMVCNIATDGAPGVATVVKALAPTLITSTASQTVASFTPTVSGVYRVALGFVLNNGVSGNAITVQAVYRDATGQGRSVNLVQVNGSTMLVGSGTNSFSNGSWAGQPMVFYAQAGTAISLVFRDPTNTPNDTVYGLIEWLA